MFRNEAAAARISKLTLTLSTPKPLRPFHPSTQSLGGNLGNFLISLVVPTEVRIDKYFSEPQNYNPKAVEKLQREGSISKAALNPETPETGTP